MYLSLLDWERRNSFMRRITEGELTENLVKRYANVKPEEITYKEKPLTEYLDQLEILDGIVIGMNDGSEIDDDDKSNDSTWSSEKIYEELLALKRRINNLIVTKSENGVETVDKNLSELLDIRLDVNGVSHTSAGDAVRDQINDLLTKITNIVSREEYDKINSQSEYSSSICKDAIIQKIYKTSGNDTNILKVPNVPGYLITSAVNKSYDDHDFFVLGVGNKETKSLIFSSRIIPEKETVELIVTYTKKFS